MTGLIDWIGPALGLVLAGGHELLLILTGKDRLL